MEMADTMNNKFSIMFRLILVFSFVLASCGPVTPVPIQVETTKEAPSIQTQQDQVGPRLAGQNPPVGQRLEISSPIEFTFDREMDQTQTADAFTLLDSNNKPVPGKRTWTDPKTFSFQPESKLEPSTVYKAIFSSSAVALDGQVLQDEVRINLTTIDALFVGQVFPVDRAEDVDLATNITVIFNHPVVPIQIKEEQG
jgi:hypothetical protein